MARLNPSPEYMGEIFPERYALLVRGVYEFQQLLYGERKKKKRNSMPRLQRRFDSLTLRLTTTVNKIEVH